MIEVLSSFFKIVNDEVGANGEFGQNRTLSLKPFLR